MACNSCFCWRDIRRAIVAIGIFSLVTSLFQILVTVSAFTGVAALNSSIISFTPTLASQIAYELYIALSVFDFFVALFALVLLCGNERTDESKIRSYFLPWLILIPFYIIYESAINIYYFYNQFNGLFSSPLNKGIYGFAIVPLVYWIIKDLFLAIGWIVVAYRIKTYCVCHVIKSSLHYQPTYTTGCTAMVVPVCQKVTPPPPRPTCFAPPQPTCYVSTPAPPTCHVSLPPPPTCHAPTPPTCSTPAPPTCNTCGGTTIATTIHSTPSINAPTSMITVGPTCGCKARYTPAPQHAVAYYPSTMNTTSPIQPCYGSSNQMVSSMPSGAWSSVKPVAWSSGFLNNFMGRNNY